LPGTFLEVGINGRVCINVWQLPSSALSQQGEIWYVTEDNSLNKFAVEPLFSNKEFVYVEVPEKMTQKPTKVVVHPLSTYLAGMQIKPVVENDNV
jgi:hypothetical protein